jgi:hypothetical protein
MWFHLTLLIYSSVSEELPVSISYPEDGSSSFLWNLKMYLRNSMSYPQKFAVIAVETSNLSMSRDIF